MSTRARKNRKRAGEQFVRTPKQPTPILDRTMSERRMVREIQARGLEGELNDMLDKLMEVRARG